ncbi:MAG: 16S rRNA (cytosine(1402)-N(4))-methyltransferase RsmH [Clostridia bacterium]|nr:16S rRNA (cytosine(1402)-N(4))-methyltransferase RsmH [Clostridia bacterium]
MEFKHIPVLLNEVIEGLNISPSGFYLDCTLGGAGHSTEVVKRLNSNGILIGFDKDIEAINTSAKKLKKFSNVVFYDVDKKTFSNDLIEISSFNELEKLKKDKTKPFCILIKEDFKNSIKILTEIKIPKLNGILVDLGVSSYQIDNTDRGFSFKTNSPLDMRMDQSQILNAKDIINTYSEKELLELFYKYGEEEFSKSIVRNIVKARNINPIETTKELNDIIENSMPKKIVFSRGGAAKKVFQALRIEVNGELAGLEEFLTNLISLLLEKARICIISFHSLEDRIVKNVFRDLSIKCICPTYFPKCVCDHRAKVALINKKPIIATEKELDNNSRSASAKLRIAEVKSF